MRVRQLVFSPSRSNSWTHSSVALPVMAVRYDATAYGGSSDCEPMKEEVRRDWTALKQAGFNCLVIHPVSGSHQRGLIESSRQLGFTPVVVDREVDIYVRTGVFPGGCVDLSTLVTRVVGRAGSTTGPWITACHAPRTPQGRVRATELAAALRARGGYILPVSHESVGLDGPGVAFIGSHPCEAASTEDSCVARWLGEYHGAVIEGRTDGILFDGGLELAAALTSTGSDSGVAERAGVAELMHRVRSWGPLLTGSIVTPVAGSAPKDVKAATVHGSRRRGVLVWNASADSYARGEVSVPVREWSGTIRRLVQWSGEPGQPAGRIVDVRNGVLRIPVELRPGDAELYEAF
jgi:hypothetical protein